MNSELIKPIKLLSGSHADIADTGQGCFMNVVAYFNAEPEITDRSPCVCEVVRPIAIWINDYLLDAERHVLLRYIEQAMGSATREQRELLRRAKLAVRMAYEMQDIGRPVGEPYASYAAAAVRAAESVGKIEQVAHYAAQAARYATNAASHAAKGLDHRSGFRYRLRLEYKSDCSPYIAYLNKRKRIIDSCLAFLDESLPKAEMLERNA